MSNSTSIPGAWTGPQESSASFAGGSPNGYDPYGNAAELPAPGVRRAIEANITQVGRVKPIIIAVFGQTGTGKTSFIKAVSGQDLEVGHNLTSCTENVLTVECKIDNQDIILVDTPGFSDTNLSDTEVLERIAGWMQETYEEGLLLSGIIYMHRIIDVRMDGPSLKNLRMMRSLCGSDSLKNVVLATSMWERIVTVEEGQRREDELKASFWKSMMQGGSRTARLPTNTKADATKIVRMLLNNKPRPTRLQEELHAGLKLPQTDAAAAIRQEILRAQESMRRELDAATRDMKKAIESKNQRMQTEIKAEMDEVRRETLRLEEANRRLEKAKPRLLPKVKSRGFFGPAYWYCLACKRKTFTSGTWVCKNCNFKQKNIW